MFGISYAAQIAWLILFMLVMVHYDWRKHGAQSRRWREYLFVLGAGILGILFMLGIDAIAGTISREYYYYMRDISDEGPFRLPVAMESLKVGFPIGVLCGGVLAAANNPKPDLPPLPWRGLVKMLFLPLLCGIIFSPFGAILGVLFDPMHFGAKLAPLVSKEPEKLQRFLAIWGVTVGLYSGGLAGLFWSWVKIRADRRKLRDGQSGPALTQPAPATTPASPEPAKPEPAKP